MPPESDDEKAEYYIAQFLYGIIPFELWDDSLDKSRDPFEGMTEEEKRIAKRKYRKLKRRVFGTWKGMGRGKKKILYGLKKYVHDNGKRAWFNYYIMGKTR